MKTTNKFIRTALMLFVTALVFTSCSPEDGKDGIDGQQGIQGPQGPTGNANVTLYKFGSFSHTGSELSKSFALTQNDFEQSLVTVFVSTSGSNSWYYPLPGYVTPSYEYRVHFRNPSTNSTVVLMNRVSGSGTHNFTGMNIYVVRANSTVNARMMQGATTEKHYNGYTEEEVKAMSYEEFLNAFNLSL